MNFGISEKKNDLLIGIPFKKILPFSATRSIKLVENSSNFDRNLEKSAENLINIQSDIHKIYILTGFPCNEFYETDGPIGTLMLSEFLSNINFEVYIITNSDLTPILKEIFSNIYGPNYSVNFMEVNELQTFEQAILISIEYPGANEFGVCHSMSGKKIVAVNPLVEHVITTHPPTYWIAIGDGGNEIGQGKYKKTTNQILTKNGTCECGCGGGIGADLLASDAILGITSNFATIALIYELSMQLGIQWELNWTKFTEILKILNRNGIFDGVTNEVNSVDAISENLLKKIYNRLSNFYYQIRLEPKIIKKN
jgi:hypothetical protein